MARPIMLPLLAGATLALGLAAAPGAALGASKSCTRGGATLEQADGPVRVVRARLRPQSSNQTRRERLYACWAPTGRRVTLVTEVDNGDDNRASTRTEIVDRRYVGVRAHNEGGVSESITARIVDARSRRVLHTSARCEQVDQGDLSGVGDVAFLEGGGMAMSCRALFVFRRASSPLEQLEPEGTDVRQIAVSRYSQGFGARLFWTVGQPDLSEVTRSIVL